jgi:hypothetical protein
MEIYQDSSSYRLYSIEACEVNGRDVVDDEPHPTRREVFKTPSTITWSKDFFSLFSDFPNF